AYPEQPAQKRQRYNQRSNESAKFLGKPVCRRALAALLGIGGSTLQRLRGGESAYTQNARKPLAKHPTFGFAIRGETGHEDVDQYFSQIASYLTPQEFSTPQDVVELLDSATRPDREADSFRKQAQRTKVHTHTYKLDEVACWQDWSKAATRDSVSGNVGQLRFALRQDLDPASFGTCEIEELRRHEPHGFDVLLLAKKFMADASPFRVICLVPAEVCVRMRASFIQPSGVADRRAISEKLRKNLLKKAPACRKQGSISTDAESYLIGWAQGTWPRVARPTKYNFLELRRFDIPN
ncbi:unnamed protein product, partial [Durusdinium trenchii]